MKISFADDPPMAAAHQFLVSWLNESVSRLSNGELENGRRSNDSVRKSIARIWKPSAIQGLISPESFWSHTETAISSAEGKDRLKAM